MCKEKLRKANESGDQLKILKLQNVIKLLDSQIKGLNDRVIDRSVGEATELSSLFDAFKIS